VRFSHGRKAKSLKVLDPVSEAVAEDEGGNYRQKTFVNALKNGPGNVKVDDKPMSMSYSPLGKSLAIKGCIISLMKYSLLKLR
jgi:hypothetical protein